MTVAFRLEAVATRLQEYQQHLESINAALEALRHLGTVLGDAMAEDRRALLALALEQTEAVEQTAIVEPDEIIEQPAEVDADQPTASSQVFVLAEQAEATVPTTDTNIDTAGAAVEPVAIEPPPLPLPGSVISALDAVAAARTTESLSVGSSTDVVDVTVEAKRSLRQVAMAKIIDLASRRPQIALPRPSRRRGLGMAASLLVTAMVGTYAVQGIAQSDFFQKVMDLATCDGEAVSAERNCALLAWMLL